MTVNKKRTKPADPLDEALKAALPLFSGDKGFLTQDGIKDMMRNLAARLVNLSLQAEMDTHMAGHSVLAGDESAKIGEGTAEVEGRPKNKRNGSTSKKVKTDYGLIDVSTPRDRNGDFQPVLLPKHARTFNGFSSQIIAMYASGMTTRDIAKHIEDLYGVAVSAEYISTVTDAVLKDAKEWQERPLESIYPVVFFDALRVKIRSGAAIRSMAVHIALGVAMDGSRDVLGMWINENEGASFWVSVFSNLKARGVNDILIAVTDGLKGMTQALEAVFPQAQHQSCIVHMIRASTKYVANKDLKAVCNELKKIYQASSAAAAEEALMEFEVSELGQKYKMTVATWRRAWEQVIPFFEFPPEIRKLIYTTNSIEGLNRAIRKVTKTRAVFPNEDAAKKLIFLAIRDFTKTWIRPNKAWAAAMPVFMAKFGERIIAAE